VKTIDSHLHLWDPARFRYPWLAGRLNRAFLKSDLPQSAKPVDSAIFVQADCLPLQAIAEAEWAASLTSASPEIAGIVAYAPLERGHDVQRHMESLSANSLVCGVRRILQGQPDQFLNSDALTAGLKEVLRVGMTFDACITWHQVSRLITLVDRVPSLKVVVDHLAKPPVTLGLRSDEGIAWSQSMLQLSLRENVFVKLSGLGAEVKAGADLAVVARPFLEEALQMFGPARCMFGSDWPVSMITPELRPYSDWFDLVRSLVSAEEEIDVQGGTASRFYSLNN
jgi:L-fuconolactonase